MVERGMGIECQNFSDNRYILICNIILYNTILRNVTWNTLNKLFQRDQEVLAFTILSIVYQLLQDWASSFPLQNLKLPPLYSELAMSILPMCIPAGMIKFENWKVTKL